MRPWMIIAAVAVAGAIAVAGVMILRSDPSTAEQVADLIQADGGGACGRVATQRSPARDDDGSGFQARAGTLYLFSCEKTGPIALIVEYPSRDVMLDALKLRPKSEIFRGQQVCVLEKSLVFGSFPNTDTLTRECPNLGGRIEQPISSR